MSLVTWALFPNASPLFLSTKPILGPLTSEFSFHVKQSLHFCCVHVISKLGTYFSLSTITSVSSRFLSSLTNFFVFPSPDAPLFVTAPSSQSSEPGKVVTLKCRVDANPPPEIIWTRSHHSKVTKLLRASRLPVLMPVFLLVPALPVLLLC